MTEQKLAELRASASESRLRTVMSSAPVVLFAIDQQHVFTMAEGRGLEALNVTSETVVGSSMHAIMKNVDDLLRCRRAAPGRRGGRRDGQDRAALV